MHQNVFRNCLFIFMQAGFSLNYLYDITIYAKGVALMFVKSLLKVSGHAHFFRRTVFKNSS